MRYTDYWLDVGSSSSSNGWRMEGYESTIHWFFGCDEQEIQMKMLSLFLFFLDEGEDVVGWLACQRAETMMNAMCEEGLWKSLLRQSLLYLMKSD